MSPSLPVVFCRKFLTLELTTKKWFRVVILQCRVKRRRHRKSVRKTNSVVRSIFRVETLCFSVKNGKKRRPPCQFGVSCYRKNPVHRAENSHPGDSDYDDSKLSHDNDVDDESSEDRPECPFGKSCYRQNPQHKREFKH